MTLKDELMEIQGVGDARADEIIAIVESHKSDDTITKALEFFDRGKPNIAESVLRNSVE